MIGRRKMPIRPVYDIMGFEEDVYDDDYDNDYRQLRSIPRLPSRARVRSPTPISRESSVDLNPTADKESGPRPPRTMEFSEGV